jgi:hypothetical protein
MSSTGETSRSILPIKDSMMVFKSEQGGFGRFSVVET